ncbi:MAG: 3'(2'),5'-bisphosphate nucleotidase CysQ [Aestuariivirga sp.]
MPESDPKGDLALLIRAAQGAGEIAMQYWRNSPRAWDKADGAGPVTEADMAVNVYLETLLRTARPDYGWLSEESPDDGGRAKCEHVFIVDPIDGTRSFIAGEQIFAHAIAVSRGGKITAGVVYLPALGKLYAAALGGAATLNGEVIHAGTAVNLSRPSILTGKPSLAADRWLGGPPELDRHFRPSLAYRLCLVADGSFDGVLSFRPCWEWDIAAGSLIAQAAGAMATGPHGQTLMFNVHPDPRSAGLWAAGADLHAAFCARMA